jgi:hypothetical protein
MAADQKMWNTRFLPQNTRTLATCTPLRKNAMFLHSMNIAGMPHTLCWCFFQFCIFDTLLSILFSHYHYFCQEVVALEALYFHSAVGSGQVYVFNPAKPLLCSNRLQCVSVLMHYILSWLNSMHSIKLWGTACSVVPNSRYWSSARQDAMLTDNFDPTWRTTYWRVTA